MTHNKLLVCGTKGHYTEAEKKRIKTLISTYAIGNSLIEGCCPLSPDTFAEEIAAEEGKTIEHYPSNPGNYLKRNIEMVTACDAVLAFWDGYSYGTAHTIAHGLLQGKKVTIINVKVK